jgi:predicted dehydrogenase
VITEPLNVAIAGAGLMGRWHAYYAHRSGARIAAILDRDADAARRLAARYPPARVFTELAPMLRDAHPAVLHICTPSATHVSIARTAIDAGVNLMVEKPLAGSAAETELLLGQAASCHVRICPVHQFVYQDGALQASGWLPSLGRLLHMQSVFCSAGGAGTGGAGLDEIADEILVHPLSLMASLAPGHLQQRSWSALRPSAGEMRVFGEQEGVSSSILISLNGRPAECSFHIIASNGSVYLDLFHGFAVMEPAGVSRSRKIAQPFETAGRRLWAAAWNLTARALRREPAYPGLPRLIGRFYDAVSLDQPSPFSQPDILAVARARDEIVSRAGMRPRDGMA